nr:ulp1 protease family, C-terminal catalytic domain-containing protein [Tanacetum cinerariifolium]
VFFPYIKLSEEEETSNHYYLICFNMITAEIDIIDNIHNDLEDLDLRYSPYAMALINSFIDYLEYIKHPKVDAFFSHSKNTANALEDSLQRCRLQIVCNEAHGNV